MYKLTIENMHCMSCIRQIQQILRHYDPAAQATADLATKTIEIHTSLPEEIFRFVIQDAGYKILACVQK